MKVLLTGATGFLGKQVLKLLATDERVTRIDVVTRKKSTYPNSKVRVLKMDLSDPACANEFSADTDAVIHLAGAYDFTQSLSENYQENVLPTLNLISKIKEWNALRAEKGEGLVPFFYASTFAVGFGMGEIAEKPLQEMPSKKIAYAFSKAVADRAVTDSGIPGGILRLGILVGTSDFGEIEKLDGPYYVMKLLHKLSVLGDGFAGGLFGLGKRIPVFPVPAREKAVLPVVPVDYAARAFHEALFLPQLRTHQKVYGVYNAKSVEIGEFVRAVVPCFLPSAKIVFIEKAPQIALSIQEKLTQIPEEIFLVSSEPIDLNDTNFKADFEATVIPRFEEYSEAFVRGFKKHVGAKS